MRALRSIFAVCSSAAVLALSACGHKTPNLDAPQAQAALNTYFAARNPVCQSFFAKWPVQVSAWDVQNYSYHAKRLAALEDAGLVQYQITKIKPSGTPDAKGADLVEVKSYTLTPAGQAVYRNLGADNGQFCYASKTLDHITSLSAVSTQGAEPTASVHYTYQLQNVAAWAANAKMQEIFPILQKELAGVGQEQNLDLRWRDKTWQVDPVASL